MAVGLLAGLTCIGAGCSADVPVGKQWTVDAAAWHGSDECAGPGCSLDAYSSRDFTLEATVRGALTDGAVVQVHCFVPTPAPQRDPVGRDAHRWYLLTVDSTLVWAPDVALTSAENLRVKPVDLDDTAAVDQHLVAGLGTCHSAVPGR
jgi:hypothetical protein